METYTNKELERIHEVEKNALADFARTCEKYNLSYWLVAGAALGAIRHKGPIPWDDDIDVGMLRKDYEKFLSICQEELGDRYRFINYQTEKDYPLFVTNMAKRGTKFVWRNFAKLQCTMGIGIDIFPYDNVPRDIAKRKRQIRYAWFLNKLYIVRNIRNPEVPGTGILKKTILLICGIAHYIMVFFHVPRKSIISRYLKAAKRYDSEDTGLITTFCVRYPERTKIYFEDLFPLSKVPYMDIEVYIPSNYNKMLENEYGDYMKLPPVEKRRNHYPYQLDFGNTPEE